MKYTNSINTIKFIVLSFFLWINTSESSLTAENKTPIKIVIVTMFETGNITGDQPGELQFWVERLNLNKQLRFDLGEANLYTNDDGVMAILVGGGISNATASIMALGLDERFDLTKTYWLVAGVAGGDPADISLGSAAWAKYIVDGDLAYEIDAREMPQEWPYGMIPLGSTEPTDNPEDIYETWTLGATVFKLNETLTEWAYDLTKNIKLNDSNGIQEYRKLFIGYENAIRPPFVTIGDNLSASTYWHGRYLTNWANDWVRAYAGNEANFMTSGMEDSGTMTAIRRLSRLNIVDPNRILILRTISNYTMPPPGKDPQWSRTMPYPDQGLPSFETAFKVGNKVVQELINNWHIYKNKIPNQKVQ